jgi:hypothetical protein
MSRDPMCMSPPQATVSCLPCPYSKESRDVPCFYQRVQHHHVARLITWQTTAANGAHRRSIAGGLQAAQTVHQLPRVERSAVFELQGHRADTEPSGGELYSTGTMHLAFGWASVP